MSHCVNNSQDRKKGEYWEREFCKMLADYGKVFTPLQIGRDTSAQCFFKSDKWHHSTLPDVTVWTSPGEHHELKHKNPTKHGAHGLEKYRFDALLWFAGITQQKVFYTIHNHDLTNGSNDKTNDINHWFIADIATLNNNWNYECYGNSWVNGVKKSVKMYYWNTGLWTRLTEHLDLYGNVL